MNALESQIFYPDLPIPPGGSLTPIADRIFWLRKPLPFALDHINLWLIDDELDGQRGWTVVDTGVATPEVRALWREIRDQHFHHRPILRVICTHMHPDHLGLASWLCHGMPSEEQPNAPGAWQAPLWMTLGEYKTGRMFASKALSEETEQSFDGAAGNMVHFFKEHGAQSAEDEAKALKRKSHFSSLVPHVPSRYHRMMGGQRFHMADALWEVIPGYGHSPEHAALWCEELNLLISGDMVLPRISTNMSVWAHEPDGDPLGLYLESLHWYEGLPENTLVLPSHGKPFGGPFMPAIGGGLHTRLKQLHDHHAERLETALKACVEPKTCADMVPVIFPRALDAHQYSFAMGETIAHMNHLWHTGQASRSFEGGVYRFQAV